MTTKKRTVFGLLLAVLMATPGICSQPNPDFPGNWKLSNERSMPKRTGDAMFSYRLRPLSEIGGGCTFAEDIRRFSGALENLSRHLQRMLGLFLPG